MARNPYLDFLALVPLFSAFSKRDIQKLASASTQMNFEVGQVIAEQGTRGREAFVILSGQATVTRNGRKVAELGPGSVVGELALLDQGPRTATVTVKSDVTALVIGQREFFVVLEEVPALSRKLLSALASRIRDLDRQAYG
ncbi:MAG: cyclic nucleotide-binding protein [Acidimicrobiia bacterium]|nr:cyclic nucleotide-binding protein [Acidimicrobiia bacterium]